MIVASGYTSSYCRVRVSASWHSLYLNLLQYVCLCLRNASCVSKVVMVAVVPPMNPSHDMRRPKVSSPWKNGHFISLIFLFSLFMLSWYHLSLPLSMKFYEKPCGRSRGEHSDRWSSYEPFLWGTIGRRVSPRQPP